MKISSAPSRSPNRFSFFCDQSIYLSFSVYGIPHLSCGINDFSQIRLTLVDDLMAKRVLDGRIVALDEMAFAILHREGRFA